MHYDNPNSIPGQHDNSGVKIYYDTTRTQYLGGVMQLGDAQVNSDPLPAKKAQIHNEYSCPASCTSKMPQKVNIFGDFLHAHGQGTMLYSTITDANGNTRTLNRIEYYDNRFEQITPVSDYLDKGESLNTHCVYQTMDRTSDVEFFMGTSDEMCLEYVFYYPRFDNALCIYEKDQNTNQNFTSCFDDADTNSNPYKRNNENLLSKAFGAQPATCPSTANSATGFSMNLAVGIGFILALLISC